MQTFDSIISQFTLPHLTLWNSC